VGDVHLSPVRKSLEKKFAWFCNVEDGKRGPKIIFEWPLMSSICVRTDIIALMPHHVK